ncbi:MAG: hypothetical protein IJR27_07685 [Synergistaceae bacterium]|nr:hypothetical protein [Synergistaceae bacterium]MBQ9575140.1 hypothetical protein [Synergistaceae bacterium]
MRKTIFTAALTLIAAGSIFIGTSQSFAAEEVKASLRPGPPPHSHHHGIHREDPPPHHQHRYDDWDRPHHRPPNHHDDWDRPPHHQPHRPPHHGPGMPPPPPPGGHHERGVPSPHRY